VGTILRTARFFGLGVVLVGGQDPWAPKVVRAAAGALLELPPAKAEDAAELVSAARAAGFEVLALDAHGGEDPLRTPLPARVMLVLGAEGPGLAGSGLDRRVRRLTIVPGGDGQGESLNVAVSFGIVAAAWAEERRA
jgi:tRNA G18 (ribose-2'-O)-methylase SpoU